ncbi:MAG TPA: GNAT family N-acetyltransferase [Chthonomonadales bacterium]|nr:GNAT family N-acetyltransferase [Chthonomonadales bacterium]
MVRYLGSATIATGERMEVLCVEGADAAWREPTLSLLAHKGPEWQHHIAQALDGATDDLETRFHLGVVGGQAVANVMTVERHGVGILGHVYTRPERRRQGICKAVLGEQMADFRTRGGRVLLLGTEWKSPAYWIYHAFGFRSLCGGFMRYAAPGHERLEEAWFAPRSARVVEPRWEHWPLVALLGSVQTAERLRIVAWHVVGIENLEWGYCSFCHGAAGSGPHGRLLQTDDGAVVGVAIRHPFMMGADPRPWPGVWLTDLDVHPSFGGLAAELLAALPDLAGEREVAWADPKSLTAVSLEASGFRQSGTLSAFVGTPDGRADAVLFERGG